MQIRLDLPSIYEELARPISEKLSPQDKLFLETVKQIRSGNAWKDGETETPIERGDVVLDTVILPTPFANVYGGFSRKGSLYAGETNLTIPGYYSNPSLNSREIINAVFRGLGERLPSNWMQLNENAGYFLLRGKPKVAVSLSSMFLQVELGKNGTKAARFKDYESFSTDGLLLEQILGICVNSGVDYAVSLGQLPVNPDIEVLLRPKN